MCKCVLCAGRTVETHGSNETLINIVYPWNMTVTRISLFDTSHPLSCIPSVILPHSVPAGLTGVRWLILAYVSSRDCQTHSLIQAEHIHSPSPCRHLRKHYPHLYSHIQWIVIPAFSAEVEGVLPSSTGFVLDEATLFFISIAIYVIVCVRMRRAHRHGVRAPPSPPC